MPNSSMASFLVGEDIANISRHQNHEVPTYTNASRLCGLGEQRSSPQELKKGLSKNGNIPSPGNDDFTLCWS